MPTLKDIKNKKPFVFAKADGVPFYVFGRLLWDNPRKRWRCSCTSAWRENGGWWEQDKRVGLKGYAWFVGSERTHYQEFSTLEEGAAYLAVLSL